MSHGDVDQYAKDTELTDLINLINTTNDNPDNNKKMAVVGRPTFIVNLLELGH